MVVAARAFDRPLTRAKEEQDIIIDGLVRDLHAAERALMFIPPLEPVPQSVLDRIQTAQERLDTYLAAI